MEETKVHYHGEEVVDNTRRSAPPPYTSGVPPGAYGVPADPYGPTTSVSYGPSVVHTTHVVGTSIDVVGTNVGMGGTTTVYPAVVVTQQISPKPTKLTCKSCQCEIVTRIETKPTIKTHFFAALLCLMGCWCCVCIPYCTDSCLNSDHYCPNCNAYIGSHIP